MAIAAEDGVCVQLVEEKKKVVAEWVSVEDAQREYDAKRNEYVALQGDIDCWFHFSYHLLLLVD